MIDFSEYRPKKLKVEAKKIIEFNFSSEKRDIFQLNELIKKIYIKNISLNELRVFLVNIKLIYLSVNEEIFNKIIDSVKVDLKEKKVCFLEKYIYFSMLELFEEENFNIVYTHLKKMGKTLYKFMDFVDNEDNFRRNFQKLFQKTNNISLKEFLLSQLEKENTNSKHKVFFEEYLISEKSNIYNKIID